MIGIIPGKNKTYEVYGKITDPDPVEGKLYYDPYNGRVYVYSTTDTRSGPDNGFFPIWDGKGFIVTKFSNEKYFDKDVTSVDMSSLSSSINKDVADQVLYMQRRSENDEILKPTLSDEDNMFTQCIKGVINSKNLTMIDLVDMSHPKLTERAIENYYSALTKIAFMRLDKWNVWVNIILHITYDIEVYKDDKMLLSYSYPKEKYDTGIVKYDNIINQKEDSLKTIIKIIMVMENITKASLKTDEIDDYTINNMMTTLNSDKALSAQLFSRFIRMSGLSYVVKIYDTDGTQIFEYKES